MPSRVFTDEELETIRECVSLDHEVMSNSNPHRSPSGTEHFRLLSRCVDILWGFDDETGEIFEPKYSECSACHGPIERYSPPSGTFWSHFEHPADEHDAEPV